MRALYVRSLTAAGRAAVDKALRCSNTVTHRRARMVVLSEAGQRVAQIAVAVGMHPESVRRAIRAVNTGALPAVLYQQAAAGKGQELEAARAILDRLNVRGHVITGDALLAQREVCRRIVKKGALPVPGQGEPADSG